MKKWSKKNKIVISGAPGVGKTTILEILKAKGHKTLPEVARKIIERSQSMGSNVLPWEDADTFQNQLAIEQLEMEHSNVEDEGTIYFLDRGLIDGYAFCEYSSVTPPQLITEHGFDRYEKVFLLEPLGEYKNDPGRLMSEQDSKKVHELLKKTYKDFGYELIFVPAVSPLERVDFILKNTFSLS